MHALKDAAMLGTRLSELRRAAGCTQAELARAIGVSEATLSRIEKGASAISAPHLFRAAETLGHDIADFFETASRPMASGARALSRRGDAQTERIAGYRSEILCAALTRKAMHPAINTVTARDVDAAGGLSAHDGEEFLHVLEGTLVLHTDLYQPTRLRTGDSLYFDGRTPHAYVAADGGPARILVVLTGATG